VRQLLPPPGETSPERVWRFAFAELEAHAMDLAVIPTDHIPARFHQRCVYEEDFVIAMRTGHLFADDPTLERYCEMQHLVVSYGGAPRGFIDEVLAKQGRSRRIVLTVPNFMFALAVIADTDLICALPRRFVAMHAARFGVLSLDVPLPLANSRVNVLAPKVAMMDAGLAWLFDQIAGVEYGSAPIREPTGEANLRGGSGG
jgi:DNA-binding transcriptional LysR family regulator